MDAMDVLTIIKDLTVIAGVMVVVPVYLFDCLYAAGMRKLRNELRADARELRAELRSDMNELQETIAAAARRSHIGP